MLYIRSLGLFAILWVCTLFFRVCLFKQHLFYCTNSQPLVTTMLLKCVAFLDSTHKWYYIAFFFLCLTYFTKHNTHQVANGKCPLSHAYIIYLLYFYTHIFIYYMHAMATHSSTLAWKIPWTEEPGRLQSMGSLRVGHNWATSLSLFTFMHWRRKWQPTPVFLPGESQGQGSLVGCRLWGHTESDTTEVT